MFTYALDEYGDFEGLKNTNKPIYIGGVNMMTILFGERK